MVTINIPIISQGKPTRPIFAEAIRSVANTIALGGVPTGYNNAYA
jgi:hypothetical protein